MSMNSDFPPGVNVYRMRESAPVKKVYPPYPKANGSEAIWKGYVVFSLSFINTETS